MYIPKETSEGPKHLKIKHPMDKKGPPIVINVPNGASELVFEFHSDCSAL